MDEAMKYPSNVLTAIENGCVLDLRVKLAVQFLTGDGITALDFDTCELPAAEHAAYALDLASALLDLAESRGLVKQLPEYGELPRSVRLHIERNVRAHLEQNAAAERIGREGASAIRVASPMPGRTQ